MKFALFNIGPGVQMSLCSARLGLVIYNCVHFAKYQETLRYFLLCAARFEVSCLAFCRFRLGVISFFVLLGNNFLRKGFKGVKVFL